MNDTTPSLDSGNHYVDDSLRGPNLSPMPARSDSPAQLAQAREKAFRKAQCAAIEQAAHVGNVLILHQLGTLTFEEAVRLIVERKVF